MRIVLSITILLSLVGCGGIPKDPTFIANRSGVLFYGDSIFGKWDLDAYFPGKGYVNGGHFGMRTDQLLSALPDALSGNNVCSGYDGNPGDPSTRTLTCRPIPPPATIVILAGWNDMFQGMPDDPAVNIAKMVGLAHRAGVNVVLCTVYPFDPGHPASWMVPTGNAPVTFYDGWRIPLNGTIAQERGVTIVDLSGVFNGESDYTIDGVHPNASGYAQMHNAIAQSIN